MAEIKGAGANNPRHVGDEIGARLRPARLHLHDVICHKAADSSRTTLSFTLISMIALGPHIV